MWRNSLDWKRTKQSRKDPALTEDRLPTISACRRCSRNNFPRSLSRLVRLLPLPQRALSPLSTIRLPRLPPRRRTHRTTNLLLHFRCSSDRHRLKLKLNHSRHRARLPNPYIWPTIIRRRSRHDRSPRQRRCIHQYPLDRLTSAPSTLRKLLLRHLSHHLHSRSQLSQTTRSQQGPRFRTPSRGTAMEYASLPRRLRIRNAISLDERSCFQRQGRRCSCDQYDLHEHVVRTRS